MRRVLYAAAAVFAAFSIFTACDKTGTENGDGGTEQLIGSIADIPGTYNGNLTVKIGNGTPTDPQNQNISITASNSSENAIDLTVANFSFGTTELGDISLTDIPVTEDENGYSFEISEPQTVTVGDSMECDITISGTVTSAGVISMDLQISTIIVIPINVAVTFEGTKTVTE